MNCESENDLLASFYLRFISWLLFSILKREALQSLKVDFSCSVRENDKRSLCLLYSGCSSRCSSIHLFFSLQYLIEMNAIISNVLYPETVLHISRGRF